MSREVLILGSTQAGKTLLLRRLRGGNVNLETAPTVRHLRNHPVSGTRSTYACLAPVTDRSGS